MPWAVKDPGLKKKIKEFLLMLKIEEKIVLK